MKPFFSLFCFSFLTISTCAYSQKIEPVTENIFIGTYNGLNKNVEFEFIADNGNIYAFQEIGDDVKVDLYEEENYAQKFQVTWIIQRIEILDEEGELTGEVQDYNMIVSLNAL